MKTIIPDLGVVPRAQGAYVTEATGVKFRPGEESIRAAGASLIEHCIV